jgi:hypothetical protein
VRQKTAAWTREIQKRASYKNALHTKTRGIQKRGKASPRLLQKYVRKRKDIRKEKRKEGKEGKRNEGRENREKRRKEKRTENKIK